MKKKDHLVRFPSGRPSRINEARLKPEVLRKVADTCYKTYVSPLSGREEDHEVKPQLSR